MRLSKIKSNIFRTRNNRMILCYFGRDGKWVVGVQGTSFWYEFDLKENAKMKIIELINKEVN